MYRSGLPSHRVIWTTTAGNCLGVCNATSQEEVIFTTSPRISWICFRNFSGPSSKPKGTVPTGKDYTPRKTTSVPVSNSRTVRRAPVHGVSWPMNRPKPTVSKSSATKDRFVSRYSPIALHTERGREELVIPNPDHVQLPLIHNIVEHLQKQAICTCDSVSATPVNWVMDQILGKL